MSPNADQGTETWIMNKNTSLRRKKQNTETTVNGKTQRFNTAGETKHRWGNQHR